MFTDFEKWTVMDHCPNSSSSTQSILDVNVTKVIEYLNLPDYSLIIVQSSFISKHTAAVCISVFLLRQRHLLWSVCVTICRSKSTSPSNYMTKYVVCGFCV